MSSVKIADVILTLVNIVGAPKFHSTQSFHPV